MDIIPIKSKKQDNGLWGMPRNCYQMDNFITKDERKEIIRSAAITLLNERYNRRFEIFYSCETSFSIRFEHKIYTLMYSNHEVIGDVLYQFVDDKEHNIFLRKQKLVKLCQTI